MTRDTGWYAEAITGTLKRWHLPRTWSPVWQVVFNFRPRSSPFSYVQIVLLWRNMLPHVTVYVLDHPSITVERVRLVPDPPVPEEVTGA